MERLIKDSGVIVLKKDREHLFMLMAQYIQASFKMISLTVRVKKLSRTAAFILVLLRMVTSMELANTDNQTNRLSMRVCG